MAAKDSVFRPGVKRARVLAVSWHSGSAAHGGKAAARRGGGEVAPHVQEQEEVSLLIWVHASSVD